MNGEDLKKELAYIARRDFFEKLENEEREAYVDSLTFIQGQLDRASHMIAMIADFIYNKHHKDHLDHAILDQIQKFHSVELEMYRKRKELIEGKRLQ
jgi:hypothetical protein